MIARIYLRYSDKGQLLRGIDFSAYPEYRVFTKENILDNFISTFNGNNITVMADNCEDSTISMLENKGLTKIVRTFSGDTGSFNRMIHLALEEGKDEDCFYFVEDDYLHLPGSLEYILEGLSIADYVTLYDSLDKYKDTDKGGYNPYIYKGGEDTKVILSSSCHWKYTNATTNTFASKIVTLKQDIDVLNHFSQPSYPHTMDFLMFRKLITERNRILINCIPGKAAHCGLEMPPFINWFELVQ